MVTKPRSKLGAKSTSSRVGTSVAFQGVLGAYSEQAARLFFARKGLTVVPRDDFAAVFSAVSDGDVDFGVLPVENSLTGSIHQNYDLILGYPVQIVGEVKLPVAHSLLAVPGAKLGSIKEVYSHPQALAQCAHFLRVKLRQAAVIPYFDTAGSARFVAASGRLDIAAIASEAAGERYQLTTLKAGIQDHQANFTRFLVIQRQGRVSPKFKPSVQGQKTSVVFSLKNAQGALYRSLSAFAVRDIDLLKIESRPIPGRPWHYMFYLDFVQPKDPEIARRALGHLAEMTDVLKVLGTYTPG